MVPVVQVVKMPVVPTVSGSYSQRERGKEATWAVTGSLMCGKKIPEGLGWWQFTSRALGSAPVVRASRGLTVAGVRRR